MGGQPSAIADAYTYCANGDRTNMGYQAGSNDQLLSAGTNSYTYDNKGESEDADKNCYREGTDVYLQLPQPLVSVTNKTQQFVRLKPLKKASRNCFKKLYIKTT
jgi:hypothetical protein